MSIKAPPAEDASYLNRKGFHSVGCQLVCDAQGLLLSAETNWPGALRAADVLRRSSLSQHMQQAAPGWLLGEAAAPTPLPLAPEGAEIQHAASASAPPPQGTAGTL